MEYNHDLWVKRHRLRTDISLYCTHFTKPSGSLNTIETLYKILTDRKLIGSNTNTGFIIGNKTAVCFQDAPLSGLTQNLIHEQYYKDELGGKRRYIGNGIAFSKEYLFSKGARPVIYEEKGIAKSILPESEHWRIVNYDLSNTDRIIDWTH